MSHSLAETRGDTVQDDVDKVMVSHLGMDIESIDIVHVFLHSTCLLEITDFVKSSVWLVMVTIAFLNGILNLFPTIEPMLVGFPSISMRLLQYMSRYKPAVVPRCRFV